MARQNGGAMRSSRLLWATPGLSRGAGTHVTEARGKDLHLRGDVRALTPGTLQPLWLHPHLKCFLFVLRST